MIPVNILAGAERITSDQQAVGWAIPTQKSKQGSQHKECE